MLAPRLLRSWFCPSLGVPKFSLKNPSQGNAVQKNRQILNTHTKTLRKCENSRNLLIRPHKSRGQYQKDTRSCGPVSGRPAGAGQHQEDPHTGAGQYQEDPQVQASIRKTRTLAGQHQEDPHTGAGQYQEDPQVQASIRKTRHCRPVLGRPTGAGQYQEGPQMQAQTLKFMNVMCNNLLIILRKQ